MTTIAELIHNRLDEAGLGPSVHYCATSHDWRTCLELIEREIEDQMEELLLLQECHPRIQRAPGESLLHALRMYACR